MLRPALALLLCALAPPLRAAPAASPLPLLAQRLAEQLLRAAGERPLELAEIENGGAEPAAALDLRTLLQGRLEGRARLATDGPRLRVLAVLSPGRSPIFPDVPTIAESGYPGFEASVWYGVIAPAATPAPLLSRWHAEVQRALDANDVRQRLTSAGGEVLPGPIESFAGLIRSERIRYERLVREAQIKPD